MLKIDNRFKLCLMMIIAVIVPGSGYVITGKSVRGLLMLMWMFVFAFITYHLTDSSIPFPLRLSGGIIIWILTVVETWRSGKRKLREE